MKTFISIPVFMLFILAFIDCDAQNEKQKINDFPVLRGPYLGQKPPGMKPEIFAPGIVSTKMEEFGCTFSPDGNEFYFTRITVDSVLKQRKMTIMFSRLSDSCWSIPEVSPFCEDFKEGEPNFSPSGDMLLYGRLVELEDGSLDPWQLIIKRTENGWTKPRYLINGMFSTITSDSIIYYTDVSRGHSKGNIYRADYVNGYCQNMEMLGGKINSPQQDAHPFVSPEEEILIFDSNRPGGSGDNDLYICFRKDNGSWSDPVNMGATVNTDKYDAIPYLTFDRKYLFFFRNKDIYWVNASFIEKLKPKDLK